MDLARGLTPAQRMRRRLNLWMGSPYKHPDGHIELEFEEAAGIDSRNDPMDVQHEKLFAHERRKHRRNIGFGRVVGACILGFIAYQFAGRVGIDGSDRTGLGLMTAYGLWLLTRD